MPKSFKALFILILLVLFGNSITLYYYMSVLMNKEHLITQTFQMIAHLEGLRADLWSAGINARSYVILSDDMFLERFQQSRDETEERLLELSRLVADSPDQQQRLATLKPVMTERLARLERLTALKTSRSPAEVTNYFSQNFVRNEGIDAHPIIDAMVSEENRLLNLRSRQSQANLRILNVLVTIILLMDVLFVALIYLFFNRYLTEKHRSSQRFRAVFDQAAVGVEEISNEGVIINCNPRLCQMLGFPRHELIGMEWKKLLHADEVDMAQKQDARLFSGEIEAYTLEKRYLRKDGSFLWISVTSSAVRHNEERPAYRLSIVQDISARKAAEIERIALLEESQIANRLKDQFLLTVSHELRTPLTLVMGHADLLEVEDAGSAEFHTSVEAIKRGAAAQLRLVNDLLDISAITSGMMNLQLGRVDVNTVLSNVVNGFRQPAALKGIHLDFQESHSALCVKGDEVRLQQIFWNLLSNALKFTTPPGRISIALSEGDRGAMIKVADTGKGIDPEFLPYAFERFRQEDGSLTRRHGGLGIGLAIVKRLVEMHGGSIDASSPGRSHGTTFIVVLPVLKEETADDDLEITRRIPEDLLRGRSLLIIEDESDSRQLFAMSLKMAGAEVEAVEATRQGFDRMQKRKFDAVITDISLPDEDGYAFMKRIRAFESAHNKIRTIAVALTAHAHPADQDRALAAGYDSHLAKPATPQQIVEKISKVLDLDRG